MSIDWKRHFDRIVSEILFAQKTARFHRDLSAEHRAEISAPWIIRLARSLASRHIPAHMRLESAEIPWRGIGRLAEHIDLCLQRHIALPEYVIGDFNTNVAPRLILSLRNLEKRLTALNADGNERDGFLSVNCRGGYAHVTVRIPADCVDGLEEYVSHIYEGRDPPTLTDVRARLAGASERLRSLGVVRVVVFGSVAEGCATAASDIDLLYYVRDPLGFESWDLLCEAFEEILERVVDAHGAQRRDQEPRGSMIVWRA